MFAQPGYLPVPSFYQADGFDNFAVPPELIAGAVSAASNLGSSAINLLNKTGLAGDIKAACGNKPLLPGAKKNAYNTCAQNYSQAQLTLQAKQIQNETQLAQFNAMLNSQKSGIGTGGIIAIIAGSTLILGALGYLIIKM